MERRGLPWGVQWEITRLVSRDFCTWEDVSMERLDRLRDEGSRDSSIVLNKPIAPYIEDLFRRNKEKFGHQRSSKEVKATVCYNIHGLVGLRYNLITNNCRYSHLGLSWTGRTWPSKHIALATSSALHRSLGHGMAGRSHSQCGLTRMKKMGNFNFSWITPL